MTCDRYKMGYKDQRYAVVITGRDGKDFVLGWTEKADGGGLMNMATLHPEFKDCNPRIIDLKPEQAIPDAMIAIPHEDPEPKPKGTLQSEWMEAVKTVAEKAGFVVKDFQGWPLIEKPVGFNDTVKLLELEFPFSTSRRIYREGMIILPV